MSNQSELYWRPIETAPIGGIILVWIPPENESDSCYPEGVRIFIGWMERCKTDFGATHWMPLPESPRIDESNEKTTSAD